MGNGKQVLLVLHCLKRGIAFVSSIRSYFRKTSMARNSLLYADVPLRNYSLTMKDEFHKCNKYAVLLEMWKVN